MEYSDPCYFSGAKSKGPKFGSLLFKHRYLFTISAEGKARVQNSDPCFLNKDEIFFPLLPRGKEIMPFFIISAE